MHTCVRTHILARAHTYSHAHTEVDDVMVEWGGDFSMNEAIKSTEQI